MSYSIETRTVTEFVTDNTIRLPRFQRKSTWKPDQNFELAISMFKEYPLGVIVINDERGTSWLLDGRQRRNALKELRNNPDTVYDAAKNYIKFKPNESEDTLKAKFWQKVDAYLVAYAAMSDDERKSMGDDFDYTGSDLDEDGIDRKRQQEGLSVLLEIILMVHQKKIDKSGLRYGKWERLFKLDEYLSNLPYALKKDNFRIDPERLHSFLLKISDDAEKDNKQLSAEYFMEVMDENIKDEKRKDFKAYLSKNWSDMARVVDVITRSERIFKRARIGVISIKNVTPLDAQNIFSRINSGGTRLSPEELISAKPFWNEYISNQDNRVRSLVDNLYNRLGVTALSDGSIVRWDLAATLMGRIEDSKLFFEDYNVMTKKGIDKDEISNGFRLLAAWFMKGVSKVHITGLEQNKEIEWPKSVDDFVEDFNSMCAVLLGDDFFKNLSLWQRPLIKLLGESATFEFCTIILQDWKDLGEPRYSGANLNTFLRHARALFDNLVFENASGFWKGSGDSKMAKHIKQYKNRLIPLENATWGNFMEEICFKGTYNSQPIAKSNIEPLLYYQMVIRKKLYPYNSNIRCEMDHIIPQSKLKNNENVPDWFMDSVINLSILPRSENNIKRDRILSDIKGGALAHTVCEFAGIEEKDFDKYSLASGINDLISVRAALWMNTFTISRLNELNK